MIELQGFGDQIAAGAITTLRVAATSLVLGIGVGLCGAMAKLGRSQTLRRLADVYTTIIRGVPELLIILILYFGGTVAMTAVFGRYVEVDAFAAGVFALTIVDFRQGLIRISTWHRSIFHRLNGCAQCVISA